jgi:hypothetical protein
MAPTCRRFPLNFLTKFEVNGYFSLSKNQLDGATRRERRFKEMRLIKMFGLAALAAVAAMAFIGATSASAEKPTLLCNTHPSLLCPEANKATSVGMNNAHDGVGRLLSSLATVLCLNVSGTGTPLTLQVLQLIHILSLEFTGCGTNSSHTNCEVEVTELPLADLLKTGLDQGKLIGLSGKTFLSCVDINVFGTDIECEYDATGLTFTVGAQHLTAFETPVTEIGSDFLCPNEPTLDGLLHTTSDVYVLE